MDNKEKNILDAAEAEFLLYGYDGTKTTNIAKRAGVTHAMLHYYFRTKENLFNHILNDKIQLLIKSVSDSFGNAHGTLMERIEAGVGAHFDFIALNRTLPRFVVNEIVTNENRIKIMQQKIEAFHNTVLVGLQKEIDNEVYAGIMNPVKIIDLVIDIVSINVFPFIIYPVLKGVIENDYETEQEFLENRKRENIEVIRRRLLISK